MGSFIGVASGKVFAVAWGDRMRSLRPTFQKYNDFYGPVEILDIEMGVFHHPLIAMHGFYACCRKTNHAMGAEKIFRNKK